MPESPTIVMLDQLMRLVLLEALKAAVWAVVFAAVFTPLAWLWKRR
jgi:hypothetical protein